MKTKIIYCCLLGLLYCEPTFGQGYFCNPWAAYGWGCYSTYSQESVPYYALHPPVYYSRPIPRPYGDSPFPYPPGLTEYLTYSHVQPVIIKNEYMEEANPATEQQYQAHQPQRILNPFAEGPNSTTMLKGTKWEAGQSPKTSIIYPASLAQKTDK